MSGAKAQINARGHALPNQVGDAQKALQLACGERDEVRRRLADADKALSEACAESARRASQNRTLLRKLTDSQVRTGIYDNSLSQYNLQNLCAEKFVDARPITLVRFLFLNCYRFKRQTMSVEAFSNSGTIRALRRG